MNGHLVKIVKLSNKANQSGYNMLELYMTVWRILYSAMATGNILVQIVYTIFGLIWISLHTPIIIWILLIMKMLLK